MIFTENRVVHISGEQTIYTDTLIHTHTHTHTHAFTHMLRHTHTHTVIVIEERLSLK